MALLARRHRTGTLVAWLVAGLSMSAPMAAEQVAEHDVKAAYLYNFTRFVEWPADVPPANEPFRLCVVADESTTEAVKRTMAGESVGGRPTETIVPGSPKDIARCQILFIGRSLMGRAAALLDAARAAPILVVGEAPGFAKSGAGTIEFVREASRVRFEVNVEVAKRCGLSISSRLLQVARETYGVGP
jgi:hypothetical protein